MASKIQIQKFNKKVEKLILSLGGVPSNFYDWVIETKAGKLFVAIDADKSKLFSIFCRFDEPKLANEILPENCKDNLNNYSGKWNFHFTDADFCLELFEYRLKQIEATTEIAGLYDLRINFSSEVSFEERIARAIRDCFNRHKGKLSKKLLDDTIKAVGKNTPEYKKSWKDFKKTFEIETKSGQYINPFYVD